MFKAQDAEFIVFDVETTGLSPVDGDRIVEIAGIKVRNGQKVDEFEALINPERALSLHAMEVNKITEEMIADAPTRDKVLPAFMQFIGNGCLVAHNASFDLKFLCYELSLIGRKLNQSTPAMDTLKMARALLPHLSTYRLSAIAQALGIRFDETHRALADVAITVSVFHHLINMAHDQNLIEVQNLLGQFGVEKPNFKIQQPTEEFLF